MYKKKRRLPKILSEGELNVFFKACDNYMYKTIFIMIYSSGLRISEVANIRIEDIDSKNMRLFVSIVHSLRHSFATKLVEEGVQLVQVKELLWHSCIRNTMTYIVNTIVTHNRY